MLDLFASLVERDKHMPAGLRPGISKYDHAQGWIGRELFSHQVVEGCAYKNLASRTDAERGTAVLF